MMQSTGAPPAQHRHEAEVLFAEARRRRRRRRITAAVVVLAVAGASIAIAIGAHRKPPASSHAVDRPGGSAAQHRSEAVWLQGKYEAPSLAASPSGRNAVAWLHGYVGSASTQTAWLDTLRAGGWRATPAALVTARAPQSVDRFSFMAPNTFVGFGGARGLWLSGDAGETWRRTLADWTVTSVAGSGSGLWLTAQHCDAEKTCPTQVLRQPLARHGTARVVSSLPLDGVDGVDELSPAEVLVIGTVAGKPALAVSTDFGHHWQGEDLPCRQQPGSASLAAASGVVWIACLTKPTGPAPGAGAYAVYTSADLGRTWMTRSHHPIVGSGVTLLPVGRNVAWAEVGGRDTTTIVRTADGGDRWNPVPLPNAGADAVVPYIALVAHTADRAICLAQLMTARGTTFVAYTTTDAGNHWRKTPVPIPNNLPAKAVARQ